MILFPAVQTVLITPPHTGSQALNAAAAELGGQVVIGPTPDAVDVADHHWSIPPAETEGWTVAVVVRQPEARLIGLWEHLNWYRTTVLNAQPRTIEWFVETLASDDATRLSWLYRWTVARLLGTVQVAQLLRHETLAHDVAKLLKRRTMEVVAAIGQPPGPEVTDRWRNVFEQMSGATRYAARVWCFPDALRFGYLRIRDLPHGITAEVDEH